MDTVLLRYEVSTLLCLKPSLAMCPVLNIKTIIINKRNNTPTHTHSHLHLHYTDNLWI